MRLITTIALIGFATWYLSRLGRDREARIGTIDKKTQTTDKALGRWENEGGATAANTAQRE